MSNLIRAPEHVRFENGPRDGTTATYGKSYTGSAYGEVFSSTSFDYDGFWLAPMDGSAVLGDVTIKAALGGAGSEADITPAFRGVAGYTRGIWFYFPLPIKSGSRVSLYPSATTRWQFVGVAGNSMPKASGVLYYTVAFTPGVNTFGSWAEVVSSLPNNCIGFTAYHPGGGLGAFGDAWWRFEVGTGAAASEGAVTFEIPYHVDSRSDMFHMQTIPVWHPLAAGTRVVVRGMNATAATSNTLFFLFWIA